MLSHDELTKILRYDAETGKFFWLESLSNRVKIGTEAGFSNGHGYLMIGIKGKKYSAHRLAWLYVYGSMPKKFIDHINRNKSDNRIENLRECDKRQNAGNCKLYSTNSTGHRGIYWIERIKKFEAAITIDNKKRSLGYFAEIKDAIAKYDEVAIAHFGEFYLSGDNRSEEIS